ncbi:MAG TPA: YraN family protein [Ilumatobacter sp.]|nr:YraN family protein [Ilumatobacter sp.]
MPNLASRSRGRWGEARAAAHYRAIGFEILDRNWRSPLRALPGELDLVLRRGDQIVFCEVKARRTAGFGGAAHAVGDDKQSRIRALAEAWLVAAAPGSVDVRFDVIAIEGVTLTHYPSAF